MDMINRLELSHQVVNVVKARYFDCKCSIKTGGSVFNGFAMTSGVRQGCPLSPLLFVLTVDILLRTLFKSILLLTALAYELSRTTWGWRSRMSAPTSPKSCKCMSSLLPFQGLP